MFILKYFVLDYFLICFFKKQLFVPAAKQERLKCLV